MSNTGMNLKYSPAAKFANSVHGSIQTKTAFKDLRLGFGRSKISDPFEF